MSERSRICELGHDRQSRRMAFSRIGMRRPFSRNSSDCPSRSEKKAIWFGGLSTQRLGDAYASILLRNSELMDIYIEGARPEQLLHAITCGEVGFEGAVVIPKNLYESVEQKLSIFDDDIAFQG